MIEIEFIGGCGSVRHPNRLLVAGDRLEVPQAEAEALCARPDFKLWAKPRKAKPPKASEEVDDG